MMDESVFQAYVHSGDFLSALRLPAGTELDFSLLGQGEYNVNYSFRHPETGQRLVLRLNTGSQMHLEHQIEYEFSALQALYPSGRTPRPLFCDGSSLPWGALVMEWLPGRSLRYETDLEAAAEILSDIHALPVPPDCALLSPGSPARSIYGECLAMAERYLTWDRADLAASDAWYQARESADGDIVLVGIDQRALEEIGPYEQWGRDIPAMALEALCQSPDCRPAVIGLDVLYVNETQPEADQWLAEAAGAYGNVVTGCAAYFQDGFVEQADGSFIRDRFAVTAFEAPYPALAEAAELGLDDMHAFTPQIDILAALHEKGTQRMFMN